MKLYDEAGGTWSTFDAKTWATQQMANRSDARSGAGKIPHGNAGFWTVGYSVIGINVNQVENMRNAIRDYVNKIKSHLEGIDALATADNAFRSTEVQEAIKNYIMKVKEYCINLVSQLLAFSDKLADVKNAWEASMSNLAGDVGSKTNAFNSGTTYQETLN